MGGETNLLDMTMETPGNRSALKPGPTCAQWLGIQWLDQEG